MVRTISPITTSGATRVPTDANFFPDGGVSAVTITSGNYIKTTGTVAQTDEVIGFAPQPGNCVIQTNGTFTVVSGYTPDSKVSLVADPDDATKVCWLMRVASTDADTAGAGAKRTEFAVAVGGDSAVRKGEPFLFGIATRLAESWAGTDDKQVICQIHPSVAVSPAFALIVAGGTVYVDQRRGITTAQISTVPYSGPIGTSWDKWVVSGTFHDTYGRLVIHRNGVKVVDFTGPFGYSDNAADGYLKCGIYHWTSNNPWDARVPDRGIHIKGFWQVDPSVHSEQSVMEFLNTV